MATLDARGLPSWAQELNDAPVEGVLQDLASGRVAAGIEKARTLLRGRDVPDARAAGRRLVLGVALVEAQDPVLAREATRILADAAAWAAQTTFRAALAEARLQGGRARAAQGEHAAALAGVEAALGDYAALKDADGAARALWALGRLRAAGADVARGAKDLLEAAQDLAKAGAGPLVRARVLSEAAEAGRRAGDRAAARRAAIAARSAADEGEDALQKSATRIVEGELRCLAGDLDGARKSAEAGLDLARAAGDRTGGARALIALGNVKIETGERRTARDLLERAARAAQGVSAALVARAAAIRASLLLDPDDVRSACDAVAQAAAEVSGRARLKGAPIDAPQQARAADGAMKLAEASLACLERQPDAAARALEAALACERGEAWDLALRARALGIEASLARGENDLARSASDALEAAAKATAAPLWVALSRVLRARSGSPDVAVLRDVATQAERRGALPLARDAFRELARVAPGDVGARAKDREAALDAQLRAAAPGADSRATPATPGGEESLEREDLVRLVRLLGRLAQASEPDSALADVVDGAVELTGARRGIVYLRGPGGTFVLSARGRGGAALDPQEELASATIVKAAVQGGGMVASEDASRDARFKGASSVLALGSAAVLCAPLTVRGKTIGALYLDAPGAAASFDARARALLDRFASAASLAVSAARERGLVDRVLDSPLDVDELLDAALALLLELTGAARGRVLEVTPVAQGEPEIRVRAARAAGPGAAGEDQGAARTAPIPKALVVEAWKLGASVVLDDVPGESGARSFAVAPVSHGSRALAVILLEHPDPGAFSSADRDLLARAARRISRPLANATLHHELARSKDGQARLLEESLRRLGEKEARHAIVGEDATIRRALELVARVCDRDVPVLVFGESGAGKELFARALHFGSKRKAHPFVAQACGGLGGPLLESELFGHEKGAFTGATSDRIGLFEAAHGGTLLLDEVADLAPEVQAKLLRVLETGEVRPLGLGAASSRKVDVRVVATSRRDLRSLVESGAFREDLYYRLTTVQIEVPPLRKRRDDILLLASAFLERAAAERKEPVRELTPGARRLLLQHDWPGNVRELENTIARAVVLAQGEKITAEDLVVEDAATRLAPPPSSLVELSRRQEAAIEAARDGRVLTAASYRELARVSKRTAIRDLNELVDRSYLLREGRGSAVTYRLAPGK
jgi:transcriptional regulator with GAF, ATPase, and Fis domain